MNKPGKSFPRPLADVLHKTLNDAFAKQGFASTELVIRWAEIVGAEIAAHTTPESFTDGKLVVRTDSTAWATQLKLLAPSVVRRLNEDLGHGTVTVIEILGPHGPSWKKGPRSVRDGRGPRDTYG
jgi:predicted nucleic acid-binding Zn ribbon protein